MSQTQVAQPAVEAAQKAAEVQPAAVAAQRGPVRVGVIGATGYAGGELLRLLARHPLARVSGVVARGREGAVYGLPELHRPDLAALAESAVRVVGAPGCYSTAALLALAPLARAGLIGDVVVDAKSGVSGAGRELKADLLFGEVNESVKA